MTNPDLGWLSRLVAGKEKILIGLLALTQTYISQVDWLVEPEKALVIGALGLCQIWLGADSPKPPPAHSDDKASTPPSSLILEE